jgi:hypothetical protein
MKISEIASCLDAELKACAGKADTNITSACGADLMSDVLAFSKENAMLLTGLVNPQVIRTAEMMDMAAVTFVRGKLPTAEMIALAAERGIALLSTKHPMFTACGLLYANGIIGGVMIP